MKSDWTGAVTALPARGRIDIVEGEQTGLFQSGDFLLFDRADAVVVNVADKAFTPFVMMTNGAAPAVPGMQISFVNVKVVVDSLGTGESVAGLPTRRYRVNASYGMSMSAPDLAGSGMQMPAMEMQTTIDYWLGSTASIPPTPFNRLEPAASESPGPMNELVKQLASAMRSLPAGTIALKTVTAIRMSLGAMGSAGLDQVVELSNLSTASLDPARLTIPAEFVERSLAGLPPPASAGAPDKWRSRP